MQNPRLTILSQDSQDIPPQPPLPGTHGEFAGNVALVTLGCAKNLVDSEVMLGTLAARGFRPIDTPENADLIVVNTCAFLREAVEEGIDRILELAELKKNGRCKQLVVAGCMVERYRDDLARSLPEVDRFISTDELLSVADETPTTTAAIDGARRPYFLYDEAMPRVLSTAGHTAYIKIAEGCDRPCAFCIIPKIRGNFRSRPMASILAEAELLLQQGVREFNLVAQDLTAYGTDLTRSRELTRLLGKLSDLPHAGSNLPYWIRLLYAYPIGVDEGLIRAIADSPAVCNYLDLPLQHISQNVLKRMRRPLGERGTRGLIEKIRAIAPEIALRTTFVVGFPGETQAEVEALGSFIREGHFAHVGVFTYSQEEEAASYTFPDQIESDVSEERRQMLMELQQDVVADRLASLVGSRLRVLIDGFHEETDLLLTARAEWQAPETDGAVLVNELPDSAEPAALTGQFADVEITEVAGYDLVGRVVSVG